MISDKICLKVKFEREKRGLSQEEFASKTGLSRNAIWKIETGKVKPTLDTLEKIANALEMEFVELIDVSKVEL